MTKLTFQVLEILEIKIQDIPGGVGTLSDSLDMSIKIFKQ